MKKLTTKEWVAVVVALVVVAGFTLFKDFLVKDYNSANLQAEAVQEEQIASVE